MCRYPRALAMEMQMEHGGRTAAPCCKMQFI
jgi:hypothetical protein